MVNSMNARLACETTPGVVHKENGREGLRESIAAILLSLTSYYLLFTIHRPYAADGVLSRAWLLIW